MEKREESEEEYDDSSSTDAFSNSGSQEDAFLIPTKPCEMAPASNYKTVCCYGCQIEFPENKTPFPSQMSVMTSVRNPYVVSRRS